MTGSPICFVVIQFFRWIPGERLFVRLSSPRLRIETSIMPTHHVNKMLLIVAFRLLLPAFCPLLICDLVRRAGRFPFGPNAISKVWSTASRPASAAALNASRRSSAKPTFACNNLPVHRRAIPARYVLAMLHAALHKRPGFPAAIQITIGGRIRPALPLTVLFFYPLCGQMPFKEFPERDSSVQSRRYRAARSPPNMP